MNKEHIDVGTLSKGAETMFITLYARALDYESKNSILCDKTAHEIAKCLNYDFEKLQVTKEKYTTAIRARELDSCISRFIAQNTNAVVVDLGCGLDSRRLRVNPPSGVCWYDVDFPEVINLRKHFYSESAEYFMLGSSVLDYNWLTEIPSEYPVIIVADGVLPFIAEKDIKELFAKLTSHFHNGEIAFNGYTTMAVKMMKNVPSIKAIGVEANMGFDNPREPENWTPRLKLVGESFLIESEYASKMPAGYKFLAKLMALNPKMKREGGRILRYTF